LELVSNVNHQLHFYNLFWSWFSLESVTYLQSLLVE
jgi:hypothetical protein